LAQTEKMMQNVMNRRWLLAGYPEGMPTLENWTLDRQPVPDPGPGQILVKAKWLSIDPYMRGRMSPSANYTKGVAIGEVMQGGGVGELLIILRGKLERSRSRWPSVGRNGLS
jgi:NADPH-dependent curcumin reductase CurA